MLDLKETYFRPIPYWTLRLLHSDGEWPPLKPDPAALHLIQLKRNTWILCLLSVLLKVRMIQTIFCERSSLSASWSTFDYPLIPSKALPHPRPRPIWILEYAVSNSHPAFQCLPTKLAEWIGATSRKPARQSCVS